MGVTQILSDISYRGARQWQHG